MAETPENIIKIIEKYKDEIINISGDNEKEIFTNFYSLVDRKIIEDYIEKTFVKTSIKCEKKSTDFRNHGNECFKTGNYDLALKNYTDSLNFAPNDSENFSLALANRSAVFFALNDYKSCITDIKLCLEYDYPKNLKHKIYLRLVHCYSKVFQSQNVIKFIEILKNHLADDDLNLTEVKKEEILQEIVQIEKEISEKNIFENHDIEKIEEKISIENIENFEENKNFAFASNLLTLQYNNIKGRYVLANQDIKMGQILFVEKPFSSVPIFDPENSDLKNICYHCFTATVCPIPCTHCKTQFCSKDCFNISWESYHRFECAGSCAEIWPQIGVNYLATRMLILGATSGYKNVFTASQTDVEKFGDRCNNYDYVCSLVTNVGKMGKSDVFPHIVSAMILINYLQNKTDFFQFVIENRQKLGLDTPENREYLPILLGSALLKHILQIIANASTIESVKNSFYKSFNSTEQIRETGFYFSGVGIYPSVSMMNHSCDVNISSYFVNDYIIVKAKYDLKEGAEIFNSYGYDCRKQVTVGRKEELKKQHFFECECTACTVPSMPELFHEGLLCQTCKGPSLPKDGELYQCTKCDHEFNAKNHFSYIKKAEQLYEKYERTRDVELLKKCLELRQKVFYKYNFSIYTTHLDLQNFYGVNGDIKMWWHHTQNSLELDKDIVGENSLKVGMNMRLCLLILLRYLSSLSVEEKNDIRKVTLYGMIENANNMFESMKNIFTLYYDENKINFDDIDDMLQDCLAVVTHILGEEMYTNTIEDDMNELYYDQLSDLQ